jgi:hypothetical protein
MPSCRLPQHDGPIRYGLATSSTRFSGAGPNEGHGTTPEIHTRLRPIANPVGEDAVEARELNRSECHGVVCSIDRLQRRFEAVCLDRASRDVAPIRPRGIHRIARRVLVTCGLTRREPAASIHDPQRVLALEARDPAQRSLPAADRLDRGTPVRTYHDSGLHAAAADIVRVQV